MASLTIRNIDDDLKHKLAMRAARKGLSVEEDLRRVLSGLVSDPLSTAAGEAEAESVAGPPSTFGEAEMRERVARVMAHARRPDEPADWKAARDELHDFLR